MTIRAVLFDAGNTVVEADHEVLAALLARHGVDVDPAKLREAAGRSRALFDRFLAEASRSTESRAAAGFALGLILDALEVARGAGREALVADLATVLPDVWTVPAPGVFETLDTLTRRGIRTALVSNSDGHVAEKLAAAGLGRSFEVIVDSALVGVEKPDPRIFAIALERLKVARSEALYVGDLPSVDGVGARAAGLAFVLVDPFEVFNAHPGPRIRTLPDLLDIPALHVGPDELG